MHVKWRRPKYGNDTSNVESAGNQEWEEAEKKNEKEQAILTAGRGKKKGYDDDVIRDGHDDVKGRRMISLQVMI